MTWPSFREWQTTRIASPHREVCAAVWLVRDGVDGVVLAFANLRAAQARVVKAMTDLNEARAAPP